MSLRFDVKALCKDFKVRRALLYAPSMEIKKLEKAAGLKALDTVAFDLEDGVPPALKEVGRKNIVKVLNSDVKIIPELALRINSVDSRDSALDLNQVMLDPVAQKRIKTVIIPKVEDPEEVRYVERWLRLNDADHAKILAMIETPKGLVNVDKICKSSPKLDAIIFGAEDYRSAAGIERAALEPIQYARSAIVASARAAGVQAIDMTSVDFRHREVCEAEARGSRAFGFTGRQVIHPMQIECVNAAFTPRAEETAAAVKLIKEFVKTTLVDGKGVCAAGGSMIELPHITDAIRSLLMSGKTLDEVQAIADSVL